ncbi:MAG: type II toxin-antitoxin system RelE/ParE family toxin [Chitinophagaceae bacterium]|nr:type II toxin-antitoxin system RelE/ParE family toxin [Chitinophagaceae bacterium]
MKGRFAIVLLKDAVDHLEKIEPKAKEKILYNFAKSQYVIDKELFKKLNGNIWEFRTRYRRNNYRFFAFWDHTDGLDTLVIVTHGILKKTQKISSNEIENAENLRVLYFKNKTSN